MAEWRTRILRAAFATILFAGAASAAANVLVVRSQGQAARTYRPGMSLGEDGSVTLGANDLVVILSARGTRTFRGPGTFRVAGPIQGLAYSNALGRQGQRARIGAVRGRGAPPAPDIWQVDVSRDGPVCIANPTGVTLWRPNADSVATLTVGQAGGNDPVALPWAQGQHTAAWPSTLPLQSGAEYELQAAPGRPATRIRVAGVVAASASNVELAAAFIAHGCEAQLDRLIDTTPEG